LMPVLSSLLAGAVDLRNRHMLFAVATALCEQHKGKVILIAGDEITCWKIILGARTKALEAAAAVKGVAIFPQLSAEQKERGMQNARRQSSGYRLSPQSR